MPTTTFTANNVIRSDNDIKSVPRATGVKTLTTTDPIPKENTTINSITFNLGILRFQGNSHPGTGNHFFLTNKELSDYSTTGDVGLPSGGIDYIQKDTKYTSKSINGGVYKGEYGKTVTQVTVNNKTINTIIPFSTEDYTGTYHYDLIGIKGNTSVASNLLKGATSLSLNFVGVFRGADRWKIKTSTEGQTNWSCTVNWSYTNTCPGAPSNLKINSATEATVGKQGKATLTWTAGTAGRKDDIAGANVITGYAIYKNGVLLAKIGNQLTYEVTGSNSTNATDTYTVKALGVVTNYGLEESSASNSVTLKTSWSAISFSSFTIAKSTGPIYVGTTNSIEFAWTANNGTNNTIQQYIIYCGTKEVTKINASQFSGSTIINNIAAGTYTIKAVGSSGSTSSAGIIVNLANTAPSINITAPTNAMITTLPVSITFPLLTLSYYKCSEIKYSLLVSYDDWSTKTVLYSPNTSWANQFHLTDLGVPRGTNFKLKLSVDYYALNGGSTTKEYDIAPNEGEYKIFGQHKPSHINYAYDKNADSSTKYENLDTAYGYEEIYFNIELAQEDERVASGKQFEYHLLGFNTSNALIIDEKQSPVDNIVTIKLNSYDIKEGEKIKFQIQTYDEYGLTAESNVINVIRIKKPVLDKLTLGENGNITLENDIVSHIKYNSIGINGVGVTLWTNSSDTTFGTLKSMQYNARLLFNNTEKKLSDKGLSYEGTAAISGAFNYLYCRKYVGTISSLEDALYNAVINQGNPFPVVSLVVETWYDNFSAYKANTTLNIPLDFTAELSSLTGNFYELKGAYEEEFLTPSNYLNPFETLEISIADNEWYNAAGELNGGGVTIATQIFNGSQELTKDIVKITDPQTGQQYEKTRCWLYQYNNYNIQDTVQTFTVKQTLNYKNSNHFQEKSANFDVMLVRWYNDIVGLKTIKYIEDTETKQPILTGVFTIPAGNLGSTKYHNAIETITYTIKDAATGSSLYTNQTITRKLTDTETNVAFETSIPTSPDITKIPSEQTVIAELTFTNSDNKTITVSTAPYYLSSTDVTMAIRKNKIRINSSADFGVDAEQLDNAPIFEINGLAGSLESILSVISPNTPTNNSYIELVKLSTQGFSSIFQTNGKFLNITNLQISPDQFDGILPIGKGGTGATDASTARALLEITPTNIGAMPLCPSQIELITSTESQHGGYIDFHFNGNTADFTSRIIEDSEGVLNLNYGYAVKIGNITNLPTILNDAEISVIFGTYTNSTPYALIQSFPNTHQLRFVQKNGGDSIESGHEIFNLPAPDLSRPGTYAYDILTTKSPVNINEGGTGAIDATTARRNLGITPGNIGAVPTIRTINGWALSSDVVLSVSDVGIVYSTSEPATGKIWLKPKG